MRVAVSTLVTRPAEQLFWLSQDYTRRREWDRYLVAAHLLGPHATPAVGVEAYCRNRLGQELVSRYVSFRPPTHTAVQMTNGPWLLASFAGTWRFTPQVDGRTEVAFLYSFKARPAGLRWLLEPLIAGLYRHDMRRRLLAFRQWAEAIPETLAAG